MKQAGYSVSIVVLNSGKIPLSCQLFEVISSNAPLDFQYRGHDNYHGHDNRPGHPAQGEAQAEEIRHRALAPIVEEKP
jgi:hypothetical protein